MQLQVVADASAAVLHRNADQLDLAVLVEHTQVVDKVVPVLQVVVDTAVVATVQVVRNLAAELVHNYARVLELADCDQAFGYVPHLQTAELQPVHSRKYLHHPVA